MSCIYIYREGVKASDDGTVVEEAARGKDEAKTGGVDVILSTEVKGLILFSFSNYMIQDLSIHTYDFM